MNALTGFQLIAATGLQNGEGINPPNITANLNTYNSFAPVNNYSNIVATASSLPYGLTSANANLLMSIGSNSFPHLFGQIPNDFSSQLGTGILFQVAPARTANWFGGFGTANVYLQVLNQAQAYASTAQAVIGSAAQTQWAGGPASSATGGFSNIGGNDPISFIQVADAISELGTLMVPTSPMNGFSNADCFNRILESGTDTIGNLHLTFYGQQVIDPTTGNSWTIGSDLFTYVLNNPVGMSVNDTFQIAALNPFDAVIGQAANQALTQTGDLDAVVSFFEVGPNAASSIYQWTDALNVPLMLGKNVTATISSALKLNGVSLNTYYLIQGLVTSIVGLTNIPSMTAFGNIMAQLAPLTNSSNLLALSSPISQSTFSNIQTNFGPGSGTNGNPTVDDILGSTNYNQALTSTIMGLNPLRASSYYVNVSADTTSIRNALTDNVFPVTLSDGSTYSNINSLAVGGTVLVNKNANALANIASTVSNVALFTTYNQIAQTHNNSIVLSSFSNSTPYTTSPYSPINLAGLMSNELEDIPNVSSLIGLIFGIIYNYYGASSIVKIDNPPQPTMFQKVPGTPNFSSSAILGSFPSSLASMAALQTQIPNSDEITGLNNVSNCIDSTSLTGQALSAVVKESQNNQVLNSNGLPTQSLATNPVSLTTPAQGTHTIGGV